MFNILKHICLLGFAYFYIFLLCKKNISRRLLGNICYLISFQISKAHQRIMEGSYMFF